MKPESERAQWIEDARDLLDESARNLDAASLSRLNRARQAALRHAGPRRTASAWLPAAAFAGACALLVALAVWRIAPVPGGGGAPAPQPAVAAADGDDAELAADDSLEMYQNLEFYAWLEAQERDGDG